MIALTYLIYIIFWETLCLGGCAYFVIEHDADPLWFVLAVVLSGSCIKPSQWKKMTSNKTKVVKVKEEKLPVFENKKDLGLD